MPAPLQNDTFLRALRREPTPYTPIWLMRQAGRYLPEYNATRARAGNFLNLCKTPELATEVTLQPLERFALDAAILFSDILTIPDAMGLGLHFVEGEGPRFKYPLRTEQDILRLAPPDPTVELRYVLDAVRSIRHALAGRVPLIGFSGSPFTLACYMVEGGGSDDYRHLRTLLYKRPDLMHHLLEVNRKAVSAYLAAQVEAGAQVLMIFDTWGGMLTPGNYRAFSLAYMAGVIADLAPLTDGVPVIVFTKGGGLWLEAIAQCGSDAVGLDWTIEIADAKRRVGDRVALQGNLDPFVLLADGNAAVSQARQILDGFGADPGHIFNLGHGISQYTPPEHVSMLVEEVHNYSRRSRENQAGS